MADKDDDSISVQVDDGEVISVNVEDNVTLATAPPKEEAPSKEKKETKTKRVLLEDQQSTSPSHEQALAEAQAFAKKQEDGRKAAEATANNERLMREDAQRRAEQSQRDADQSRERADTNELVAIDNGIASATRELEAHESEYTRAAEAGEFAKMANIQTKISRAAAALDRLENAKATFDINARRTTTEGRVVDQPTIQTNPVEKYLSGMAPRAQSWMRQHMDCVPPSLGGDSVRHSAMMEGHYAALKNRHQEGSDDYFKTIEDYLNPGSAQQATQVTNVQSRAADVQVAGPEATKLASRQVQPSAPVSRDAQGSSAPRNVREVRLTKDQQEMAKVSFPHLPEAQAYGQYARNLIELEAEGKIGRSTH